MDIAEMVDTVGMMMECPGCKKLFKRNLARHFTAHPICKKTYVQLQHGGSFNRVDEPLRVAAWRERTKLFEASMVSRVTEDLATLRYGPQLVSPSVIGVLKEDVRAWLQMSLDDLIL